MREIRTRIKSVQGTRQITKAMKMVSAAKLRRSQRNGESMRLFSDRCREILGSLLTGENVDHPLLTPRLPVKNVTYLLFMGNRGLCGSYNSALVQYMHDLLESSDKIPYVMAVGRWGHDALTEAGVPVAEEYEDFGDVPVMGETVALADKVKKRYLSGEADEVYLVFQRYVSALQQAPDCVRLLPATPPRRHEAGEREYIFEPSREAVLDSAVQMYVNCEVFSALQEARSAEQAARLSAMTAATDATDELIGRLRLELNRARQAAITTEISEIVGGANALKNKDGESSR
jgi:F-type H+-transporting ATPase subunit gamma